MEVFNPISVEIGRNLRGMSQSDLSKHDKTTINQSSISKIEKGELQPSEETIREFADALNFPKSFFYINFDKISALSFHAFRKKAGVPNKYITRLQSEMTLKSYHQHIIHSVLNLEKTNEFTDFKGLKPNDAAKKFRDLCNISQIEPIDNLTNLVESLGIDLFLIDFIDAEIDGVTSNTLSEFKAIFINKHQPSDRYRFSLAHELGHYLLHSNELESTPEMEQEANEFASELLMPENGIKEYLKTTNLNDYANLKKTWKVSMAALIFRAKILKCIDEKESINLWKKMSMYGYRKVEPFPIKEEIPQRINRLLHEIALKNDNEKIYEFLNIYKDDFMKFYPNFEKIEG
jgi:Zn-dependent peptidase ImmA (M78 family)/transcriptional regulator with XRE-family HTH domain